MHARRTNLFCNPLGKAETESHLNGTERCEREMENLETFEKSFMVIGNRVPVDALHELEEQVREYNTKEPFCLGAYKNLERVRQKFVLRQS